MSTNPPEHEVPISGSVDTEHLAAFIADRVEVEQPDPEELAAAVAQYIEHPERGLTREEVVALIDEHDTGAEVDYDLLAEEVASRLQFEGVDETTVREIVASALADELGPIRNRLADLEEALEGSDGEGGYGSGGYGEDPYGGGGSGEDPSGGVVNERIDEELQYLRLIGRPTHREIVETGTPGADYHPFGDWGVIITVDEPVQWRSAVIDAEAAGVTEIVVYEMDYEDETTYDLGDVHATTEISHSAGVQQIYPEIVLPEGQYFISRDADQVVPMRRVETDLDWDEFNTRHDAPITFEASWRAHADYRPGTSGYEKYRTNNWHQRLYYFGDIELAHGTGDAGSGGGA